MVVHLVISFLFSRNIRMILGGLFPAQCGWAVPVLHLHTAACSPAVQSLLHVLLIRMLTRTRFSAVLPRRWNGNDMSDLGWMIPQLIIPIC